MTDFIQAHILTWDVLLTVVGLTGFHFAGKRKWWSWYINIACQGLWFTYAIVTEQYGFIAASLAYTYVFTKNAIAWTREHFRPAPALTFSQKVCGCDHCLEGQP